MVYIYYGRAGTGKTQLLTEKAVSISKEKIPVYIIVPEQLSMTREHQINSMGLENVNVLTFSRLANTIFRALGGTAKKIPDKAMCASAVYKAVSAVYKDLRYYKSVAYTGGFIEKLLTVFSEFDVNCMSMACLNALPENDTPHSMRDKYFDLFTIYAEYKRLWKNEYKSPGDDISLASSMLETSDLFEGSVFMFDGFYGFTPQQNLLLVELFKKTSECYFAFTTDLSSEIFQTVTNEAGEIDRLATKHGKRCVYVSAGDICHRLKSPALSLLEKNVFTQYNEVLPDYKNDDSFTVYNAKNLTEELNYIALKIKNDVLKGTYRYRDIAVLSPDADNTSAVASAVFKKHGVPVFIDAKKTLLSKPVTAFALSALDIAKYGFEFENVFAFLKTGLTGLPFDDISLLENYVRLWNIKPRDWKKEEWTQSPFGLGRGSDEDAQKILRRINMLRLRIYGTLAAFSNRIRNAECCRDILFALYSLYENFEVKENLDATAEEFLKQGDIHAYNEYTRIYGIFIEMLDSIDEVYGEEKVVAFEELLRVCASKITVSSRPARADEVIFAGIGRVRAETKKCIYIPSMEEGKLPSDMSDSSLITEADKRVFTKYGIKVPMDFATYSLREKFDLYSAMFSASEKLVMSRSLFKITGDAIPQSEYLKMMCTLTGNKGITASDLGNNFYFASLSGASDFASRTGDNALAKKILERSGHLPVSDKDRDTILSDKIVRALYSDSLRLSYTGVEEYVSCPFKFFLDKGLRISKSEPVEFNPANIGTFIHSGLEHLLCDDYDLMSMNDKELTETISGIADNYYETELADCKGVSKRFDFLFSKARRAFESAAKNVVGELKSSHFRPVYFEVEISEHIPPIKIGNGYTLTVTGSIDRVDMAKTDTDTLYKIVDYKSGSQEFSLDKIYNGLSMQLPLYAGAIRTKEENSCIAAFYYLKVGMPVVSMSSKAMTDEEYKRKEGIFHHRDGMFTESSIGLLGDTDTYFSKMENERIVEQSDIDCIIDYSLDRMKATGDEIVSGNTRISPIQDKQGGVESCKFCDFKSICKVTDDKVRTLAPAPDKFYRKES